MPKKMKAYPTQRKFIQSEATIVWMIGPQGEGKTFSAFWAMVKHAERQGPNATMHGCIIRDSFENIKRMTIPSIRDALAISPGVAEKFDFSDGGKKLRGPGIDVDLMGIDDLASLSKMQGGEYSFVWLEEPAPILAKANSGLPVEVYNVALSRVARQCQGIPRLQITMNPGDEDHWTYHMAIEDPINLVGQPKNYIEDDMDLISTEVFNIPYGENQSLTNISRATVKAAYKDRPDLYARYVKGAWAFVQIGVQVVPEYNEEQHRSAFRLDPMPNRPVVRMWDAGHNPTCVFYQITPRGKIFILDTLRGDNTGARQFVTSQVSPLIARRYSHTSDWTDIGDPNALCKEQSNIETSAGLIINEMLHANYEGGTDRWAPRREAVKEIFNRMVDGEPMVQISRHEGILHRSLRGGWCYKRDNSGAILKDKPIKNIHSHPGDALSYGIEKLHPWSSPQIINPATMRQAARRARSYAVGKRR